MQTRTSLSLPMLISFSLFAFRAAGGVFALHIPSCVHRIEQELHHPLSKRQAVAIAGTGSGQVHPSSGGMLDGGTSSTSGGRGAVAVAVTGSGGAKASLGGIPDGSKSDTAAGTIGDLVGIEPGGSISPSESNRRKSKSVLGGTSVVLDPDTSGTQSDTVRSSSSD